MNAAVRIDPTYLLFAAFGVLGLIQWIKALETALRSKDPRKIAWTLATFFLSFVVSLAGDGGIWQILTNGVMILAFNEVIGYGFIMQSIQGLIGRISGASAQGSSFLNSVQNAAGRAFSNSAPPGNSPPAPPLSSSNGRGEP